MALSPILDSSAEVIHHPIPSSSGQFDPLLRLGKSSQESGFYNDISGFDLPFSSSSFFQVDVIPISSSSRATGMAGFPAKFTHGIHLTRHQWVVQWNEYSNFANRGHTFRSLFCRPCPIGIQTYLQIGMIIFRTDPANRLQVHLSIQMPRPSFSIP